MFHVMDFQYIELVDSIIISIQVIHTFPGARCNSDLVEESRRLF